MNPLFACGLLSLAAINIQDVNVHTLAYRLGNPMVTTGAEAAYVQFMVTSHQLFEVETRKPKQHRQTAVEQAQWENRKNTESERGTAQPPSSHPLESGTDLI